MGVKWVRESDKYSVKTESRQGCMQYSCVGIIKHFKIRVQNHQKFLCGIIKITIFLLNVAYRSDANLINGHGSIFRR